MMIEVFCLYDKTTRRNDDESELMMMNVMM